MIIETNKTFSNLLIPFSFPCGKGDFAKVQKKIIKTGLWSREKCKATYLLNPIIDMIDSGKTAACFLAHREELERFGIKKNPGTRYFTAADKNSHSFRIGNIRMYIFDSGVGVVIVELTDCSDTVIPHKLRRLSGNPFNCYISAAKDDFIKININASLKKVLDSAADPINCKYDSAMIFSCHKSDKVLDDNAIRAMLVDQLVGSGSREIAIADFDQNRMISMKPGAYWYIAPEGVSCVLATAENSRITDLEPRMTSDYIVAVVLALHKKLSAEKLFGGKTGDCIDNKTSSKIRKFQDERTFARIADDAHKYCQRIYELSSSVIAPSVPHSTASATKKAGKIALSLVFVTAIVSTIIGGIGSVLDIASFMQYTFGVSENTGMLMSYGAVGTLVLLELIALVWNTLRNTEE